MRRSGRQCVHACIHACIHAVLLNVCRFPSHDGLKWIFSNVKKNSESMGGVVFPHTCTYLRLNEQFLTLTCKDVSYTQKNINVCKFVLKRCFNAHLRIEVFNCKSKQIYKINGT